MASGSDYASKIDHFFSISLSFRPFFSPRRSATSPSPSKLHHHTSRRLLVPSVRLKSMQIGHKIDVSSRISSTFAQIPSQSARRNRIINQTTHLDWIYVHQSSLARLQRHTCISNHTKSMQKDRLNSSISSSCTSENDRLHHAT